MDTESPHEELKVTGVYLGDDKATLKKLAREAGVTMSAYLRFLIRQADDSRTIIVTAPRKHQPEYV